MNLRTFSVAIVATTAIGLIGAAPAAASPAWSNLQASVAYTVYEPYASVGLQRTALGIGTACGSPASTVFAIYKGTAGRKIKLYESGSAACVPPGGQIMVKAGSVPFTTFAVQGGSGTAQVWANCITDIQCEFPNAALFKKNGGWVRVPLTAAGGHTATYAYIYAIGMSVAKVQTFVWNMGTP